MTYETRRSNGCWDIMNNILPFLQCVCEMPCCRRYNVLRLQRRRRWQRHLVAAAVITSCNSYWWLSVHPRARKLLTFPPFSRFARLKAEGSGKRDAGIIKRDTFSFVPAKPALLIQSVVSRLSSCDAKLKSIATKISPIEQPSS